jgi:hypothetical protein
MPSVICHPDNWDHVKKLIDGGKFDRKYGRWAEFRIFTDSNVDRDKPSGKYTLPGGKQVSKDDIRLRDRFIEYGPEDVEWLLYAGVISEGREMVFHVIDDSYFRSSFNMEPTILDRRIIFTGTA